ncbi:MAG: BatD family protein [bacterium]|nr:BatD family protein [bacterium]
MKIFSAKYCGFLLIFLSYTVSAQEVTVKLGASEIGLNQAFTITVTVHNESFRSLSDFPDIPGMSKRNVSSASTTNYINGRMSSSQSRTMNYVPQKEGIVKVPAFKIAVNGKEVKSPGKTVKVGPPVKRQRRGFFDNDPFDDFFGRPKKNVEFVDVEADAFLALTTDKDEVYQGEGFTTTLAFYVSAKNRADMRFYDLGKQITEITSIIKPSNCWEESFNIENITGEPVTINNQRYTQYKVYQATFYPWNTETITFPSVDLELIKYKVAKSPSFFGRNKQEDFQKFSSKSRTVKIKELPPHPLKEKVAVGKYRLKENIDKKQLKTGESFEYSFDITGIGNISAIQDPIINKTQDDINIYDPNKRVNINRNRNTVSGTKSFSYYGIPNEPGDYSLRDLFSWVYFDPNRELYDTLRSEFSISVTGESKKNESILASDMGSFYDKIEFEDNKLRSLESTLNSKLVMNVAIIIMVLGVAGIAIMQIIRKSRLAIAGGGPEESSLIRQKQQEPIVIYDPQEEENLSLFEKIGENVMIHSISWGFAITLLWVFSEIIRSQLAVEKVEGLLTWPLLVLFPVAYFQVTKWIHRKKGKVTYLNATIAIIGISIPLYAYFNVISTNTVFYQLPSTILEGAFIFYGFIMIIFTNATFYFCWKNGTSIWYLFIPIYSYYKLAKTAKCDLYWWEYFTSVFPVRFVQHLIKFQGRKNGLEVLSWLIPIIFMPVLLYDKSDK